ncbi:MAG TPA: glycosyl hydrolase family 28-related protein [Gaiellaceae bacterium]|nr:glycosyl hydrolase family 28-related protein [Gaiellaceae bacterium]
MNVRDFGAVGDGVHDDAPAFAAAIAAFAQFHVAGLEDLATERYRAGVLNVPPGVYRCSAPIVLNRNIHLRGAGGAWGVGLSSVLLFDTGVHGIIVTRTGTGVLGDPHCNGVGSVIEHLQISAAGQSAPACGVTFLVTATLRDCLVTGFKTHGIYIQSETSVGPPAWGDQVGAQFFTLEDGTLGGTNGWFIANVTTESHGGDGLHVVGSDSNNGLALSVTSNANGGWAFFDQCSISTTYVNCLAEGNTKGAVAIAFDVARILFLGGNLTEGNGPVDHVGYATLFVGVRVAHPDKQDTWLLGNGGGVHVPSLTIEGVDGVVVGTFCPPDTTRTAFMVEANGVADTNLRLRYDATRNCWTFLMVGGVILAELLTNLHPTRPNTFRCANGLVLGDATLVTAASSAPASGAHQQGEIVKNSAPAVGQPKGWVCTVAGTPGTWVSEGAL